MNTTTASAPPRRSPAAAGLALEAAPRPTRRKILALCSGGGHWIELLRLLPAFDGYDVVLATTDAGYAVHAPGRPLHVVPDATRWTMHRLAWVAARVLYLLLRERPDVVISTGAAPGYAAVRLGKLLGAATIWVDSLANAEELSLSGQKAGRYADLWLTQWPHLACPGGPHYAGAVLGDRALTRPPLAGPRAASGNCDDAAAAVAAGLGDARRPRRIFVTVGGHTPFDRLIRAVDDWAGRQADRAAGGSAPAAGTDREATGPDRVNARLQTGPTGWSIDPLQTGSTGGAGRPLAGSPAGADEVFAQIGDTAYRPRHLAWARFITPNEFSDHVAGADLVVGHAGIGTIFAAMEAGRPLIVLPRRGSLGETRNEHQLATVRRLGVCGVEVAMTEAELRSRLDQPAARRAPCPLSPVAPELIEALQDFVARPTRRR